MPKCKGCHRDIKWIRSASGKATPIDPQIATIWSETPAGWRLFKGHVPHFATCPNADEFRKEKG